jgi:hypothetical protein
MLNELEPNNSSTSRTDSPTHGKELGQGNSLFHYDDVALSLAGVEMLCEQQSGFQRQELKFLAFKREQELLSKLSNLCLTNNASIELLDDSLQKPTTFGAVYLALAEEIAAEGLKLTIHPNYLKDPEIATTIDEAYGSVFGMFKELGEIIERQGKLAKEELYITSIVDMALGNVVRNVEEFCLITDIPVLHKAEAVLSERYENLKRSRKKHKARDINEEAFKGMRIILHKPEPGH